MKKLKELLKNDTWIVVLDLIAVNAAYFLALVIRLYVHMNFRAAVNFYLEDFFAFAPIYSILCIFVFYQFKLYNGMWRYAGVADMNRILLANVVTCVIQVAGSLLFFARMPRSYYILGALLQFIFIAAIRFSYRIVVVEQRKKSKKNGDALIIGSGEEAYYVLRLLDSGFSFRPVGLINKDIKARTQNGLPVYKTLEAALDRYEGHSIDCVFIANSELRPEEKGEIRRICEEKAIPVRDYTTFFSYSGEDDAFSSMREVVQGPQNGKRSIPFSPPDIGEAEIGEVVETLRSGWITTGPRTKLLERRLAAYIETGDAHIDTEKEPDRWKNRVACLNSATSAEELNLRILGIRAGDEVIIPAYTYTASASAVVHCGATVKFVDIRKDGDENSHSPEMDYSKLEAAITPATKAVITVDLGGTVCDYDRVFEIVEKNKLLFTPLESDGTPLGDLSSRIQKSLGRVAIVADSAHSLGASRVVEGVRKYCGAIADFTSFSFHAVKNFTTAEGGASAWRTIDGVNNAEIYKYYQLLSLHGQSKDALAKTKAGAWEYDIVGPWYKCNMTDIMAAIGLRQLDRYPGLLERRKQIISRYDAVCEELGLSHLVHHVDGMDSSNHLYLVRVPGIDAEKRNRIIEEMAQAGVATNVHYKPLPMMTAYKNMGWNIEDFPNTYAYYENLFSLPLHTLLTDDDVDFVCMNLRNVIHAVMKAEGSAK